MHLKQYTFCFVLGIVVLIISSGSKMLFPCFYFPPTVLMFHHLDVALFDRPLEVDVFWGLGF